MLAMAGGNVEAEKKNYYGVAVSRKIGIYLTYGHANKQTDKYGGHYINGLRHWKNVWTL